MTSLGEFAALLTSLSFSVTSSMFTLAGKQVGAMIVNRTRLIFAALFLLLTHWILLGSFLPLAATPDRWLWLGLSGIVGLVLGDIFLFQAFVWIGPRLSMLMMSLTPVISTILAWVFLKEQLSVWQIVGILVTLAGIVWVVFERGDKTQNLNYGRGLLYGVGAAVGQASGLVLAKNGLYGDFSPISGNLIRMLSALTLLWLITIFQHQARSTFLGLLQNQRAIVFIFTGALFGPFVGVSLSLFAIQYAEIGVASTLMALPPVFLLPISYLFFKERFGWGAVWGTLLAMLGVGFLFML